MENRTWNMERRQGFTLIELILYAGLAALLILAVSVFLATIFQSRVKNQVVSEVEGQGVQVMQQILQTIRNAEGINSPVPGLIDSALSLNVSDASLSPTVFDVLGGMIRVREGLGSLAALTSGRVLATGLTFQNLTRNNTPGTVRVKFTLNYVNPESRSEYNYSRVFTGSASLRPN